MPYVILMHLCARAVAQCELVIPKMTDKGTSSFRLNMDRYTQKKVKGLIKIMSILFLLPNMEPDTLVLVSSKQPILFLVYMLLVCHTFTVSYVYTEHAAKFLLKTSPTKKILDRFTKILSDNHEYVSSLKVCL